MGLFSGNPLKKLLKATPMGRIVYSLRNVPRDLGRMAKSDPLKLALIAGAAYLTGGAAAGIAGGTTAAAGAGGTATAAAGAGGTAAAAGAGAGATAATTAAALKTAALAAGTAATYRAGVKEERAMNEAEKQEEESKINEAIETDKYNKQVAAANERAYQANRASLLSARREYGKKIGTAYVRAGARTSDETESKLG